MRLRVRSARGGSSASTFKVEVPSPCSLQLLLDAISEALQSRGIVPSPPLGVSLNKTQAIHGPPSALLSHLGIRSGDLLFYFESNADESHAITTAEVSSTVPQAPLSAGNPRSMASVHRNADANVRRELCAAAATRRASFNVQPSMNAVGAKDMVSCAPVSQKPMDMETDGECVLQHTSTGESASSVSNSILEILSDKSMDVETGGENDPQHIPTDAGLSRVSNSIPAILQRILIAQQGNVNRPSNLLVLAVHAVMLETGFIVLNAMEDAQMLPNGWSQGGIVNLSYTLPEMRGAANGVGHVLLRSQTLGSNVLVYGSITTGGPPPRRLSMQSAEYILGSSLSHDDLISSFSDLFKLWKFVKDGLSLPLLTSLCERAGLPVPSSFLIVPTELKLKILEYLPALDLVRTGCTCSELKHLSAIDELWRKLFIEEFGTPSAVQQLPSFHGWKAAFAVRFLERKRKFERRAPRQRPQYGISSRFRFPRIGGGIIGGDYDIYPLGSGPFRGGFGGVGGPTGGLHRRLRDENGGAPCMQGDFFLE